jgi:riboflavin synthase
MFTGLVEDLGAVADVRATPEGVRLTVRTALAADLADGDSIAVDGVCLTATSVDGGSFSADVMAQTLRSSALARLEPGARVNLELPVRAGAPLGGHIVQGHVDGVGAVEALRDDGFARVVTVSAPPELLRYVVEKGSVALNGVSLTVSRLGERSFEVSLIPETLSRTNLGDAGPGTPVNIEVDVLAKYVERLVARSA